MNLQQIQDTPRRWRVLKSTYAPNEETEKAIGGVFEQNGDYKKTITLWNKDRSTYLQFNHDDLQEVYPVEYKGEPVGQGDMVKWNRWNRWHEVYCALWYDGKWILVVAMAKNYSDCFTLVKEEIKDIKRLSAYPTKGNHAA